MLKPKCKLCGGDCGLICQKFMAKSGDREKPMASAADVLKVKAKAPVLVAKVREIVEAIPAKKPKKAPAPKGKNPAKIAVRSGRPKKGAEGETLTAQEPWEKDGVSRRTWYRQQKGGK